MMKNTFKLLAVAANIYLLQLILPDGGGGMMLAVEPISMMLLGGALGSIFGGNKKPKAVTRDPEAEYEAMYSTQLKYAAPLYQADKKYTPLYTDL